MEKRRVEVGGCSVTDLRALLSAAGVRLNHSAEVLLGEPVFAEAEAMAVTSIDVVEHAVGDLGLPDGATLPEVLAAAREHELEPCPPFAGPYLRLALLEQPPAPDVVMSAGSAPSASWTIASERVRVDDDQPRGFYLRVVENVPWLRGYHCSDEHRWDPGDRFLFRCRERPDVALV